MRPVGGAMAVDILRDFLSSIAHRRQVRFSSRLPWEPGRGEVQSGGKKKGERRSQQTGTSSLGDSFLTSKMKLCVA